MRPQLSYRCAAADAPMPSACPCCRRGIFITGSSLVGAAIREPRITSKNLIRCGEAQYTAADTPFAATACRAASHLLHHLRMPPCPPTAT